jgi:tRNA (5-methylaminomethyl-2-thiouridylate)-methyltransferase
VKVALLLSGGVDSSVALYLLKDQGHDVTAFYLKVWLEDELSYLGECPWEEDLAFAREVAASADVPLEVRSLQKPYWDRVVGYVLDELRAGRTPSPDIFCNQRIKFGAFFDEIDDAFDRVASGHYARLERDHGRVLLKRGFDRVKDQTYFLSHLYREQVDRALFPIGHLTKSEVRKQAHRLGLPNRDRRDSQGICFLGKIPYQEFVRHHLGEREGDIVDLGTGRVLGRHRGFWFHTIGQRQGLGLSNGPWFVQKKDVENNVVYVTHGSRLAETAKNHYEVEKVHWISESPERRDLLVRVRHGIHLYRADVEARGDRATVRLDRKEAGIAPGQFTVFYDGEVCLGGATIVG